MKDLLIRTLFAPIKKFIPRPIKIFVLKIQRRVLDIKLSMSREIPVLLPRKPGVNSAVPHGKVYDCFLFFDELEILELRLNILNEYVDYFVICEANMTFTGKDKPYRFLENYPRFEKFHQKIIYLQLDWSPTSRDQARKLFHTETSTLGRVIAKRTLTNSNVPQGDGQTQWLTEFFQKESLHLALEGCDDRDVIYVSDADEIWNPQRSFRIKEDRIYAFKQTAYMYFLNNKSNEHWHNWNGSVVARYGFIKDKSLNDIRTHGKLKRYVVFNGGWHFSFQGGAKRIALKLDSYGHQELNVPEILDNIENIVSTNRDMYGRAIRYKKSYRGLPEYLRQNIEKYTEMFL